MGYITNIMGHPKVDFFFKNPFPYPPTEAQFVSLDHLDQEFYEMCKTKLNPDGILVTQAAGLPAWIRPTFL